MQFRCYTCGFVFHDGPPPMEALTDQQAGLVMGGRTEVEDVRLVLLSTQFSGMGAANFCDDCLLAILGNPAAFTEDAWKTHSLEQGGGAVWCSCGVTFSVVPEEGKFRFHRHDWVLINRLKMRHHSDSFS